MCVYVIMLICVCILCYNVYSVKSSWELVFIVIQKPNSNKVFLSYLISYLCDQNCDEILLKKNRYEFSSASSKYGSTFICWRHYMTRFGLWIFMSKITHDFWLWLSSKFCTNCKFIWKNGKSSNEVILMSKQLKYN